MAVSEVARTRKRIAAEYLAAQWGLSGLASGVSRHAVITSHMERMEAAHHELVTLVGNELQATEMVVTTLTTLPDKPERGHLPDVLRQIRGDTEQTAHLIDYIAEMWETIDLLNKLFGEEGAHKIIHAPSRAFSGIPEL